MSSIYSSDMAIVSGTQQISIQTGNYVQFNSLPFQINVVQTLPTSTLIAIDFNVIPWPKFPSSTTGTINGLCNNNGVVYPFNYKWELSSSLNISIPSGSSAPTYGGATPAINYTFNLASLGIFPA